MPARPDPTSGGTATTGAPPPPARPPGTRPPDAAAGHPATFRAVVFLSKREAFEACQALADADRVLVAAGTTAEAGALGDLFELLEDRMTRP